MSVSKVHYCVDQKRIVRGTLEPPAKKSCRCRKFVSLKEATQLVKDNEAKWAVTKRIFITKPELCTQCILDTETQKKTCGRCNGTGAVPVTYDVSEHSNDIVLIDQKGAVYEKPKTPRTATIESEHIERAYTEGLIESIDISKAYEDGLNSARQWDKPNAARDRIEEYGKMILEARAYVGPTDENGMRLEAIVPEPADSRERGEGPTYDYGWGAVRTCAFDEGVVIEEKPEKDKPSQDGQKNFEQSQERYARLAKLMETL